MRTRRPAAVMRYEEVKRHGRRLTRSGSGERIHLDFVWIVSSRSARSSLVMWVIFPRLYVSSISRSRFVSSVGSAWSLLRARIYLFPTLPFLDDLNPAAPRDDER